MNKAARMLSKENNMQERQIAEENQDAYTNMIVYLRGSSISDYNQEQIRRDMIEIIVAGQNRGEPLEIVVGKNYKEFCDEIINVFPTASKSEKVIDLVSITLCCLTFLGGISILKTFFGNLMAKNNVFDYSLSLADVINFMMVITIAYIVVDAVCKNAFYIPGVRVTSALLKFAILWIALFVCGSIFIGVNTYFKDMVIHFNIILAAVIVLAAAAGYRFLEKARPTE